MSSDTASGSVLCAFGYMHVCASKLARACYLKNTNYELHRREWLAHVDSQ